MSPWKSSLAIAALAILALPALSLATEPEAPPARPAPEWLAPRAEHSRPLGPDEIAVRWLGTAAFEVRTARGAILIDPHFSRHNLWQLLSGPIAPDEARIAQDVPQADAVFIGHAHHDHVIDAPTVARKLEAPLYGSVDVARVARASALPAEQMRTLHGGERIAVGDMVVEAIPSRHSDMITNTLVHGTIPEDVRLPMRFWDYKHGQVFIYAIHWRGRTIYHLGSAEIVEQHLGRRSADVVLLCMSGWKDNPGVFERLERALDPRVMVPMHHDDFFRPLSEGFHEGQLAFMDGGTRALRRAMPAASLVSLDLFQEMRLRAEE